MDTYNVLFLCTANSARSIMAEALMNQMGGGRFKAFSAGSAPAGVVHPQAIALLQRNHLVVDGLHSKPWDVFAQPGAPVMDFVLTVCDNAAGEVCPVWPGQPVSAHWGVADPSAVTGDAQATHQAFLDAFITLRARIGLFLQLPLVRLNHLSLRHELQQIGQHTAA